VRRRDDLLDGATRVLKRVAAAGLTPNRVAETGVGLDSLYPYYPNKGALLADLHDAESEKLWLEVEAILSARSLPAIERFERVVARTFEVQAAAREHHLALRAPAVSPRDADAMVALADRVKVWVSKFLAEEAPEHPDSPDERAMFCVEVWFALLDQLGMDPDALTDPAGKIARMLALYVGLGSHQRAR
jgi:AcrR family transcriptional regulator